MSTHARGRPRETSHDEIRNVAHELFAKQGYGATSLAQIAAAAGISRTTLFSYFPSKNDLLWEEFDTGLSRMRDYLDAHGSAPLVDAIAGAMVASVDYPPEARDHMVLRWRLSEESEELRSTTAIRVEELVSTLVEYACGRAADVDPALVDHVTRALVAVGARCTQEWAHLAEPADGLDAYIASRLQPFVDALRPLLP